MGFDLRSYQLRGKNLVRERIQAGEKRIMFWAMTGAGKGFQMSDFNNDMLKNGFKVLNLMKRREVVKQTIKNYKTYHGLNASPIMGTTKGFNSSNNCQVASVDTIAKRVKKTRKYDFLKEFDIVIVDECHDMTSNDYKLLIWFLEGLDPELFSAKEFEIQKEYFKKIYIGLTATPFRVGKKTHTFWQSAVKPIEAHELRDMGVLVPIRVYAPKKIDVKGIRIIGDDFDKKELYERVSKLEVIGDVVNTYRQYGQNKAAICFCISKRHSEIMAEAFRRAGISAIHCDADHSNEEREEAVKGLKSGKYKILTNCNIFSTGFDAPFIEIEISCRPTDSENLALQQWGRVLRPYKVCARCKTEYGGDPTCWRCGSSDLDYEKKEAILLDHGNNCHRWGMPYAVRQAELEPIDSIIKNSRMSGGTGVKDCPKCFNTNEALEKICPSCGYDFENKSGGDEIVLAHMKGELEEVTEKTLERKTYQEIKQKYNAYKRIEMLNNLKKEWKYFRLYDDFGTTFLNHGAEFGITKEIKEMIDKHHWQVESLRESEESKIKNYKSNKVYS